MSKHLLNVTFSLAGMIRADRDTSTFVAYCPALDLYSAGKTRIDAKRAIQSAVDMYIRLCFDREILGRMLKEKGFMSADSAVAPMGQSDGDYIAIVESDQQAQYDDVFDLQVPLHLVAAASQAGLACQQ